MNLSTPILKKFGVLIKFNVNSLTSEEVEVYFDSLLIREDWMSNFLRYSLSEKVPCELYVDSPM